LSDATGQIVERYRYDVFGRVEIRSATGESLPVSLFGNRFLFTGREWLSEVGLYDYRNRVYSAELGRFLQTDPIRFSAEDGNLYRYVGNNPINLLDPFGLSACSDYVDNLVGLLDSSPFMPQTSAGLALMSSAVGAKDAASKNNPTDGFNPNLTANNQRGQVYRHVNFQAGSELLGAPGRMAGDMQNSDNRRQANQGRAESQTELADDAAGRDAGRALKDAFHGRISREELRIRLMKILCDDKCKN
jgi:RHS repeat-associated protein